MQQIGKKLKAGIIAEGVETEGECLQLFQMGISLMQGYYFVKTDYPPLPLPKSITKQVKQKENNRIFPLKIDEDTTFSELMTWISTYQGSYDNHFAMIHGKGLLPLTEVVRFVASCSTRKEETVWSPIRALFT